MIWSWVGCWPLEVSESFLMEFARAAALSMAWLPPKPVMVISDVGGRNVHIVQSIPAFGVILWTESPRQAMRPHVQILFRSAQAWYSEL